MYLQNTWVVYGQVMEVILPKVVLPRIWAMSPEIKIKLPDFFLSFVKTSKWHYFRSCWGYQLNKTPSWCIYLWPILQWWNVTVNATWFKFSADLYNQRKQCLFNSTYNLKEYYKSIRTVLVITNILICFIN